METEETTQDQEGQDLETEIEATAEEAEVSSDDPLDSIQGEEELRAEAKKFRAIANKRKDKPVETKPKAEVSTSFVTKSDLALIATREAKEMVGEEISSVYEELMKIPLGGYDQLDPKSIVSNLKERFAIYNARKSPEKEEVPNLATTSVVRGSGVGKEPKPDKKNPPNFFSPKGPDTWYPKKEE